MYLVHAHTEVRAHHSFPTRRSSDLIPSTLTPQRRFWVRLELRAEDPRETASVVGDQGINITRLIEIFSRPPRSEEHTSELQSQSNLVCRLLLEKKTLL